MTAPIVLRWIFSSVAFARVPAANHNFLGTGPREILGNLLGQWLQAGPEGFQGKAG